MKYKQFIKILDREESDMYFFVKVRFDATKILEFGEKLQEGTITTHPLSTYCLLDDPSVGVNIWEAQDRADFEKVFASHREFYSEIIEVAPVITPQESMKILVRLTGEEENDA
jgi:hypothetical protein